MEFGEPAKLAKTDLADHDASANSRVDNSECPSKSASGLGVAEASS